MAEGKEVGRVSVKVFPDVSEFAKRLKAQLERIERQMKVEIPVEIDEKRTAKALGETLGKVQKQAARNPISVDVDPEMAGFYQRLRGELAEIRKQAIEIPVTPDTDRVRGELAAELAFIERSMKMEIPVDPELRSGFRQQLQMLTNIAASRVRVAVPVEAVGLRELEEESEGTATRVERRWVGTFDRIGASFNNFGGRSRGIFGTVLRTGTSAIGGIFESVAALGRTGTSVFGSVASSIGQVVGSALQLTVAMSVLMAVIGLVGGAILFAGGAIGAALGGLPALLALVAAPIAAMVIGFDGVKRSAEGLKAPFEAIQTRVEDTFERTMGPALDRLAEVLPSLEGPINRMAESTGEFAAGLLDVVTSSQGMDNLRSMFNNIATALDIIRPGAEALVGSLLRIAGSSAIMTPLAGIIRDITSGIAGWLDSARTSGLLEGSLRTLRTVLESLGDSFGALMTGATEFFESAGPGVSQFFDGLTAAFQNIDWASLGDAFGRIFGALGDAIARIPPEMWQQLAEQVQAFADAFTRLMESGALTAIVAGLLQLSGMAVGVWTALSYIAEGVRWVYEKAVQLWEYMEPLLRNLPEAAKNAWEAIKAKAIEFGNWINEKVRAMWDSVKRKTIEFGQSIIDAVNGAWATVRRKTTEFGQWIIDSIRGAWNRAKQVTSDAWNGIRNAVSSGADRVVSFVSSIPGRIVGALGDLGGMLWGAGQSLIQGFIDGIYSMWNSVTSAAGDIAQAVRDFFPFSPAKRGPFSGTGYTTYSGKALVQDWARGIEGATPYALRAVEGLASATNRTMRGEFNSHISSDGFGSVADRVAEALAGWNVEIDGNGMARLVNKANIKGARRR